MNLTRDRVRSIGWAFVLTLCAALSAALMLRVNAVKGQVHEAEQRVIRLRHEIVFLETEFKTRGKIEVSRFKGLGEMPPAQLKETTMDPKKRRLQRVDLPPEERAEAASLVERLMGKKPEKRLEFIQDNARFVDEVDV